MWRCDLWPCVGGWTKQKRHYECIVSIKWLHCVFMMTYTYGGTIILKQFLVQMQGFGDDNAIECRMGAYSSADSHNMNPDTDMDSFSPSAINHSDELSSNASND